MKNLFSLFTALILWFTVFFQWVSFAYIDPSLQLLNAYVDDTSPEMVKIKDAWDTYYIRTVEKYWYENTNTEETFNKLKDIIINAYYKIDNLDKKRQLAYLYQLVDAWDNTTDELNELLWLDEETTERDSNNALHNLPFDCVEKTEEKFFERYGSASAMCMNDNYVLENWQLQTAYNEVCWGWDAIAQDEVIYQPLFNALNNWFTYINDIAIVGDTNVVFGYVDDFQTMKVSVNGEIYDLPKGTLQTVMQKKPWSATINFLIGWENISANWQKHNYLACEIK